MSVAVWCCPVLVANWIGVDAQVNKSGDDDASDTALHQIEIVRPYALRDSPRLEKDNIPTS